MLCVCIHMYIHISVSLGRLLLKVADLLPETNLVKGEGPS